MIPFPASGRRAHDVAVSERRAGRSRAARARRFWRPTAAIALFAAFLVLTAAFVGVAAQTNALSREATALRAEIISLQLKHAVLDAAAAERRTESYIVDKAREYDFVRPNESLITIQQQPFARSEPIPEPGSRGHLAKWLALFFGAR